MILIGIDINRFQAVSFVVTLGCDVSTVLEARHCCSISKAEIVTSETIFAVLTQIVRLASLTFSGGRSLAG